MKDIFKFDIDIDTCDENELCSSMRKDDEVLNDQDALNEEVGNLKFDIQKFIDSDDTELHINLTIKKSLLLFYTDVKEYEN